MFENISLVVFFAHLLMATFLCSLSTGNRLSHKLLAAYLLIVVIDLSEVIFSEFYRAYLNLDMLRFNISLKRSSKIGICFGNEKKTIANERRQSRKVVSRNTFK